MNRTAEYNFTILVPFYNERENMAALESRLSDFLKISEAGATCVLMVDDGSNDGGSALAKEICERQKDFFYLGLDKNGGLSNALKAGIDNTFSPLVGYIDADLQTDPEDFNLLLAHSSEYELVLGIRANRKDTFVKKASSKIANAIRRSFTHDGLSDTGCPLKVLHTEYAKKLPFFTGLHRFIPALVQMVGGRCLEIPVRHYPRTAGKAKYHLTNRLFGPLADCFAFCWIKKRRIDYSIKDTNLK